MALFASSVSLPPASVMSNASSPSPILTQASGNVLDFYLVVPRYNFSMKPVHYSKYYAHSQHLWRLAVDPRSQTSGVGIRIECGGPVNKKKSPWSCSARLMATLVHPKRWSSLGVSFRIEDDALSKLIPPPTPKPASETSTPLEATTDTATTPTSTPVPAQELHPDPSKEALSGTAKPSEAAASETAAPGIENQLGDTESPTSIAVKSPETSETGDPTPCDRLPASATQHPGEPSQPIAAETISEAPVAAAEPALPPSETQSVSEQSPQTSAAGNATVGKPLSAQEPQLPENVSQYAAEETSDEPSSSGSTKPSESPPVSPAQSDANEEPQPISDLKTVPPTPGEVEEEEYIPRDLQITSTHLYSSTEYSVAYSEDEFAPFALLQPGMFCDDEMNMVIRVKIVANDYYNANHGTAGDMEMASVYGSSNAPPIDPHGTTSVPSSFVTSLVSPPPEPLPLEVTCRRALVQQIVELDKKIESLSSDIASDILKKEIEALNEGLDQISKPQSSKKGEKVKGALALLLKLRKPRNEEASH